MDDDRMTAVAEGAPAGSVDAASIRDARRRLKRQLVLLGVFLLVLIVFVIPWRMRSTPLRGESGRVFQHMGTARTTWQGAPATAWTYLVDSASVGTLQRDWKDVLPLATAAAERNGTGIVIVQARAVVSQIGLVQRFEEVTATATQVKGQWVSPFDALATP